MIPDGETGRLSSAGSAATLAKCLRKCSIGGAAGPLSALQDASSWRRNATGATVLPTTRATRQALLGRHRHIGRALAARHQVLPEGWISGSAGTPASRTVAPARTRHPDRWLDLPDQRVRSLHGPVGRRAKRKGSARPQCAHLCLLGVGYFRQERRGSYGHQLTSFQQP